MRIVIIVKIYIMNKFWGLALLPLSVHFAAGADELVAPALKNSIAAGKASQQRVEKAADAAVAARLELQNAQLQLRDLEAYNRYMQSLVADQQNELGKLSQQLEAVQETRQGLIPLMLQMQADLEQLSTSMIDSNEIEVKAVISLNVLVLQCENRMIISKVEERPLDMEKIQAMPGITVYVVKNGDSMWDIAKRFYTTVEEICELNELEEDRVVPGMPLLLVKKVEG